MKFRLTPFWVFILLLVVLLISCMWSYAVPQEGFISYQQSAASLQTVTVPPYSATTPLYKLYDSVYLDKTNGNVVELFGTAYTGSNVDTTGASLTKMMVVSRTGDVKDFNVPDVASTGIPASLVPGSIASSFATWVFPNATQFAANPYNYQVLYFPCGTAYTAILQYDILTREEPKFFRMDATGIPAQITDVIYDTPYSPLATTFVPDASPTNAMLDASYNYQVCQNVVYNTKTGILMVRHAIDVKIYNYDRNYPTFYVPDYLGGNMIVRISIPNTTKTMIAAICPDPTKTDLVKIRHTALFDSSTTTGMDAGGPVPAVSATNLAFLNVGIIVPTTTPVVVPTTTPTATTPSACTGTPPLTPVGPGTPPPGIPPSLDSIISNYYGQYWGVGGAGAGAGGTGTGRYSSDFLMKTQVVPPICPTCPLTPTNAPCTSCGNRACGSVYDASKNMIYDSCGNVIGTLGTSNPNPNSLGGVINNTVGSATGTVDNTINRSLGTVDNTINRSLGTVDTTINTAGDVVKGVTGDVASLGLGAIAGATSLGLGAENVVGGAVNAVGGLANKTLDTVGRLGSATPIQYQGQSQNQGLAGNYQGDLRGNRGYAGTGNGTVPPGAPVGARGPGHDQYYGSVPDRGSSNFIPVTTDFSKFGL